MVTVDLHTHTRFFHAFSGPTSYDPIGARLLVAFAQWRGLDAVAVTNHDYYSRLDIDTGSLTLIPGIEVSTTAGHVLVVGPEPPMRTTPGALTPEEIIDIAHERDCAAIVAHPFRNSVVRDLDLPFDAYEVNGKRSVPIDQIQQLAETDETSLVGGSDAHFPFEVGRAYTEVDTEESTPKAVVRAIRDGRADYRLNESIPLELIRQFYKRVHRLKGHVDH
ncbi:PHP-associated domain-containing protein [Halocatena pleomorpha]|uniref:PHP domain-containing protein n=1 Tax=Halocatena pleomorpha TaxID=1785090 RepID=A0A3P3R4H3_9EURY|nr:PHP-associated domain-containing protein [Halocatena pleomorpha]RRJ27769.1 PHP domain-containing protein [Halocatena pleomorpha]